MDARGAGERDARLADRLAAQRLLVGGRVLRGCVGVGVVISRWWLVGSCVGAPPSDVEVDSDDGGKRCPEGRIERGDKWLPTQL